jgi:hypothetical protein
MDATARLRAVQPRPIDICVVDERVGADEHRIRCICWLQFSKRSTAFADLPFPTDTHRPIDPQQSLARIINESCPRRCDMAVSTMSSANRRVSLPNMAYGSTIRVEKNEAIVSLFYFSVLKTIFLPFRLGCACIGPGRRLRRPPRICRSPPRPDPQPSS